MKCKLYITGSCLSYNTGGMREHHKDFPYREGQLLDLVDVVSAVKLMSLSGWVVESFSVDLVKVVRV